MLDRLPDAPATFTLDDVLDALADGAADVRAVGDGPPLHAGDVLDALLAGELASPVPGPPARPGGPLPVHLARYIVHAEARPL